MRIVLDTNVLVSGLLPSKGAPARVLDLVLDGAVKVVFAGTIIHEYREVLARPKFAKTIAPDRARAVVDFIELAGECVEAPRATATSPDPKDQVFLDVAVATGAVLVTGNRLDYPAGCDVRSPAELLAALDIA